MREPPKFRRGQRVKYTSSVVLMWSGKIGTVTDPRDKDGWVRVRFDSQDPSEHGIRCDEANLEPYQPKETNDMSEPFRNNPDPVHGAVGEIISAMSSLNMLPEPLPVTPDPDEPSNSEPYWLANSDRWAQHAMVHLKAALDYLNIAQRVVRRGRAATFRLDLLLTELGVDTTAPGYAETRKRFLAAMDLPL